MVRFTVPAQSSDIAYYKSVVNGNTLAWQAFPESEELRALHKNATQFEANIYVLDTRILP
jgi:hypothetical protein